MARTDPQFNLRIPAELKAKIEEHAKASGKSATSEVIARLESTFACNDDDPIKVQIENYLGGMDKDALKLVFDLIKRIK